jgi:enoyl-CoA hydratase/carnithine racemase
VLFPYPRFFNCSRLETCLLTGQAMEMILTGLPVTADDMERRGLVTRVIPTDQDVLKEALATAQTIIARSAPAVRLAKQAVKAGKSHPAPEDAALTEAS